MVQFGVEKYLALHGSENAYTSQLLEDFYFLVGNEHYHHALNVYHFLFMTVVYQTVLKAREWRKQKFKDATILVYHRDLSRDTMLETTQAFDFSKIPERTFMGYLKLFDANNNLIKDCKDLVDDRNDRSHANGNYFSDAILFEEEITRYDQILARIRNLYEEYLLENLNNYLDDLGDDAEITRDDMELDLITPQKISLSDLDCLRELCETEQKTHTLIKQILLDDYGLEKEQE